MTESNRGPRVSVILVCYNSSGWLPRCLESLRTQTIFDQVEIIIIDNASCDGSEDSARGLTAGWPNIQIIQTGKNLGFSANNRGAEVARGKYLYLVNPDTWLEPDCLERFCETVDREQADAAGGTILEYEDNTVQAKGSHGFDLFGNPVSPRGGADPQPLFCIAGFLFIRRDTFLRLGMLDERFFMYGEEVDLGWRLWLSGHTLIAVSDARIHHRGAALVNPAGGTRAVENRTSLQKRFLANRNMLLTIAKNAQHLLLLLLGPALGLLLLEFLATLLMTRSWSLASGGCLEALREAWRLRGYIRAQRRFIRTLRRHSDFWMVRFLRFGFGRWGEVSKLLRQGFPKFSR